jgi:hypothetical protein
VRCWKERDDCGAGCSGGGGGGVVAAAASNYDEYDDNHDDNHHVNAVHVLLRCDG